MATRSAKIDQKADLIWAIADKLTGVYKPHEYGDVILPLTVIRRFDCILSDTKDAVLQKYDEVKNLPMKDILLRKASKKDFYNTSKYTFERLMDDPDHIAQNFREHLNKFSANVRDILEKFKFDGHITTMANKGILYIVLKEYTTDRGNLHPNEISNLEMGYIFEEIIRRFSESHNEDAGQHYTPREVIQLMVNILFYDDNDILSGNNVAKTIYDPACGTGGMLSVAEEYLHSLNASTELVSFGQEINDQTFAICKADMLIKGNNADYIKDGNTLSDDQFAGSTFDYILSNPPFGREWKNEKAKVEEEAKLGFGGRFGAGLPAASDGQMLFLMTAISKMKDIDKGGSRIAIIHNGSPLFTGDAGSGPSEIRRHILENDLLEAIIALPNDIFYNTGIATYIWVLSNKKAGTVREGKVQLINANEMFVKRRKALGNKRNDISEEDIAEITKIYGDFKASEISQIYLVTNVHNTSNNAGKKRNLIRGLCADIKDVSFSLDSKIFGEDFEVLPLGIGKNAYRMQEDILFCKERGNANSTFNELVVMSPFLSESVIADFNLTDRALSDCKRTLVTRRSELGKLKASDVDNFTIYALKDEIIDGEEEISDELADKKKQDIHAKIYLRRKYSDVDL